MCIGLNIWMKALVNYLNLSLLMRKMIFHIKLEIIYKNAFTVIESYAKESQNGLPTCMSPAILIHTAIISFHL